MPNNNSCSLCKHNHNARKCNEEKHIETGFSTVEFSNFSVENGSVDFNDSLKHYFNKESIIF